MPGEWGRSACTLQPFRSPFALVVHQICSVSWSGVLGATAYNIIMVTLWVLFVKCKAQGITKEAILCKYSRHQNCFESTSWHKRIPRAGELFEEFVNCFRARCKAQRNLGLTGRRLHWKFTVAILAQGTSWADAATQAFLRKVGICTE